jgi:hypothetical protein
LPVSLSTALSIRSPAFSTGPLPTEPIESAVDLRARLLRRALIAAAEQGPRHERHRDHAADLRRPLPHPVVRHLHDAHEPQDDDQTERHTQKPHDQRHRPLLLIPYRGAGRPSLVPCRGKSRAEF